jgi:hypothetical protein
MVEVQAGMIGLCFALVAGSATGSVQLPDDRFTLTWMHSIEKIAWQEDWQVTPAGLVGREARIKGSGAGMEPPDFARLEKGWYRWKMPPETKKQLILARSDFVADHQICVNGSCRPLSSFVGGTGPVILEPCHAP